MAGKKHQSQWYSAIPKEYRISLSDNGWTNNDLGFEWLQEIFEKHTASQTAGRYQLLILDGDSSHATANFDHFCMERGIIPLYMPPHSSHLLQPLDTGLIPFKPERVLSKLHIKMKTPTPPSSPSSNQSFYSGMTPANLYQLNQQKKQIQDLQNQSLSSVVAEQMLEKFMKSTEVAMQDAVLLRQELHQRHTSNKHQEGKKNMT